MNAPTPDAVTTRVTLATPLPKRSVTVAVTGTPAAFAVPVVAPVIVTKRPAVFVWSAIVTGKANDAVPDVAVKVILPVAVARMRK